MFDCKRRERKRKSKALENRTALIALGTDNSHHRDPGPHIATAILVLLLDQNVISVYTWRLAYKSRRGVCTGPFIFRLTDDAL